MARRYLQQFIYAVARGMVLIARQLQADTRDLNRDRVVAREFCRTFQMLVCARFVTTLLRCFSGEQVVHYRLFSMIGIFAISFSTC